METQQNAQPQAQDLPVEKNKTALYIYICYLASFFTGITFLAGGIWAYIASGEYHDPVTRSHLQNAKTIFLWGLIWTVVGMILTMVFVGVLVILANSIWVLYRTIKGIMRFNENKAYA